MPHTGNNGSNVNENQNRSMQEKLINDICNQDVNLNRLVDDVERKLEKMEDMISVSVSYNDSLNSESMNSDINEINKENGISATKSFDLSSSMEKIYDETLCSICNMCNTDPDLQLDRDELNHLLNFVHNRVRTWVSYSLWSYKKVLHYGSFKTITFTVDSFLTYTWVDNEVIK